MTGACEFKAGDGDKTIRKAGDVILLDDTIGKGHQTRVLGDVAVQIAAIHVSLQLGEHILHVSAGRTKYFKKGRLTMTSHSIQRKLKAIFNADVKGYSRLMGDDDEHTVNTITAYREIIDELIKKCNGRVVDAPGDNILAQFDSSLDAVQSAIAIQNVLKEENEKLPVSRRMTFRIGINLGDIIHKDDRIYGDGVTLLPGLKTLLIRALSAFLEGYMNRLMAGWKSVSPTLDHIRLRTL